MTWLARLFGERYEVSADGLYLVAYYFMGRLYVSSISEMPGMDTQDLARRLSDKRRAAIRWMYDEGIMRYWPSDVCWFCRCRIEPHETRVQNLAGKPMHLQCVDHYFDGGE